MGKQSSNKKYSFTGRRTIGENKSNHSKYNSGSESLNDGSTTDDINSILNSESHKSNLGQNKMNTSHMNQMAMPQMAMPQMAMPQMSMPQMAMPQMAMPDMNQMAMNQMAMPGMNQMAMNQMAMPGMNQMAMPQMNMMGNQPNLNEIDHLMVNNLVPINNQSMNYDSGTGYMNPSQMASNLGALAKLSNNSIPSNHMGMNSNQQQMGNLNNLAKLNM